MKTYNGGNTTGFVSPAGDYLEGPVDLSEALDLRRPSRYPVRVQGEALQGRGIYPGDVLVVDAALPPARGRIAVVMLDGSTLVGQLAFKRGAWWLLSGMEGGGAKQIAGADAEIWAIAVSLVRLEL